MAFLSFHVDLLSQTSVVTSRPRALKGCQHLTLDESRWGPPWGQEVRLTDGDPRGDCDLHTPGQEVGRDTAEGRRLTGRGRGGECACSGLAAGQTGLSRGPPAPPLGVHGWDRICPRSWGSQSRFCGWWDGPQDGPQGSRLPPPAQAPRPPPRSVPDVPPGGSHPEEVRCVLLGSLFPGRGWRGSAGVVSHLLRPQGP